jgi:hypothetical protein
VGGAFYRPLGGGRYRPTEHTAGPWSASAQHLGPPSALLVRALEGAAPRPDTALARVTVEVLGPVPVAELSVTAEVERSGRAVELLAAELRHDGRPVLRARAWRITSTDTATVAGGAPDALRAPEAADPMPVPDGWGRGYLDAVEWRVLRGGMLRDGPAVVWARPLVDLVDGEPTTDLQRLFVIADSASGVSSRLDIRRWLFINTELSVHLHRTPSGEWVGMDAVTWIGPDGAGTAASTLHDLAGPVGRSTQALLVRPRDGSPAR